jgi:hypothetical protein
VPSSVGWCASLLAACKPPPSLPVWLLFADGSSVNGLAVLVPQWLEHATDMSGSLQTKHCAAALLELLKLSQHPALAGKQSLQQCCDVLVGLACAISVVWLQSHGQCQRLVAAQAECFAGCKGSVCAPGMFVCAACHPAGLMVQGRLLEAEGTAAGGRVTRAKARQQGGLRYSQVGVSAVAASA